MRFIGFPPIGQLLKTEIDKASKKPIWIKNRRLTFHIGSDEVWKQGGPYFEANHRECEGYVDQFSPQKLNMTQKIYRRIRRLF